MEKGYCKAFLSGFIILLFSGILQAKAQEEMFPSQPKKAIGVIIPLSGKWKSVGQKILQGIELASKVFSDQETPNVEYLIRDYGSDDAKIAQIIEELDRVDRVLAIIGPIGGQAGEITCKQAQQRNIPTFIFAQTGFSPLAGSYCFGNFLTIYTQTKTLLQTARDMNITRFAILYPTDQFGDTFTKSFEQLAPQYGVQIVKKMSYSPQMTDFKEVVKPLKGTQLEALLIPDTATNAAMITSYLTFFNINNVRLFGPSLWDTPDLVRLGGRNIQGAIFVSGFFMGSQNPMIQGFTSSYNSTFGSNPTIWEASAYDTAVILQNILNEDIHTRYAVRQGIVSLKNYHGVTGVTSFTPEGLTRKDVFVLTVKGSSVIEFSP
jgi:ABC-type branched-subunit amino acid transport system substrate-binding protein